MPWDPMRDLLTMQERLETLFGHASSGWVPPVDLAELDDRYVVTVELPGMIREAVTVEFQDQVLSIRGERRGPSECPERYQQLERGQGHFARSFRFAIAVAGDKISADLVNGVLIVVLPKLSESRQIPLSS